MGDPFSCIDHECGGPERDFSDDAYSVVSPSYAALGGATPSPTPHADAPIFMCSLPDSPCAASDGDDRGGGFSKATAPNPRDRYPVTPSPELALTSSGGLKRKSRVCSTRSRGRCTIRSSVSPQATPTRGDEVLGFGKSISADTSKEDAAVPMNPSLEEIEKFPNRSPETLQDASGAVPSQRMLPDSILKPPTEEGTAGRRSREKAAEARPPPANLRDCVRSREKAEARPPPANLRDCVDMLSGNVDAKFGDMDIVNVARRRGVALSDPLWWAPGDCPPFRTSDK